jgi:hypothetical protein
MKYLVCITIALLLAAPQTTAQEQQLISLIYHIAEELAFDGDGGSTELLTDMLMELSLNPVRINSGDIDETGRLFFLTPFQVLSITTHVNRTGPILSPYEIATLPGFTRELTEMIMPFISYEISPAQGSSYYSSRLRLRQRLIVTSSLRFTDGEATPRPNPLKRNLRYRIETGILTATLTASADAGEPPINLTGRPDFLSGGMALRPGRSVKNVIIGDFTARTGMGLVLNSGYKPWLSLTTSSYMGQRDGFTLYSSVNESNYLRGAAATVSAGHTELSVFISSRQRDARLKYNSDSTLYADILATPPVHNSLSSLSAKGSLTENSSGAFISFGSGNFRGGVAATYTKFSIPVDEGGTGPAGLFSLKGSETFTAGASYRFASGVLSGSGELAVGTGGALATAHSINIRADDRLAVNFLYRNYSREYNGYLSGGVGRNSTTTNEQGLMGRLTLEAARRLFLSAGADVYRSPWLKQTASFPSHGARYELKARYEPSTLLTAEAMLTASATEKNLTGGTTHGTGTTQQHTLRLALTLKPAERLTIKTNIMFKESIGGTRGSLIAADLAYTPETLPVTVWLRHAIFTTDSFGTALYLYENDMLYGFSVPAHHGEGSRTAATITIRIKKYAELRIKYSNTSKPLIPAGGTAEELKAQLKIEF